MVFDYRMWNHSKDQSKLLSFIQSPSNKSVERLYFPSPRAPAPDKTEERRKMKFSVYYIYLPFKCQYNLCSDWNSIQRG